MLEKVENMKNQTADQTAFVQFNSKEENLHYENVFDVDPKEVAERKESVYLIDVRQNDELHADLGHIPGIKHIVLDEIPDRLAEIPKDKTVVFICRSGGRSARATSFAVAQGYTSVFNMKGGMILWNELHLPTQA